MKQRKFSKMNALFLAFAMVFVQLFSTQITTNTVAAADNSITLWSGTASSTGAWSSWTSAVDIPIADTSIFDGSFQIDVTYESNSAPMLVFQAKEPGKPWSQLKAFFASNCIATFTGDSIKEALGYDLSLIWNMKVMPNGADITVTKVTVSTQKEENEASIQYDGLAGEIYSEMTTGINLGNTLDSHGDWITKYTNGTPGNFETAWGNPVTTKAMIDCFKEAGYKAVRVPVTWSQHIDDENNYKVDEAWMNRVNEVIDYVIDNDMYCILNIHHDTGTKGWLNASNQCVEENGEKFETLWTQIANRFKEYDNKLLFEGFNEILDPNNNWGYAGKESTNAVNQLNQMFVDTVRATGGNNASRCLIVNTYAANTDSNVLDDFILPTDSATDSLMAQFHFYTPWKYCSTMSEQTPQTEWKTNGGKSMVDSGLYGIYNKFTSKGIPVIMGEIGIANKNNLADRIDFAQYIADQSVKYGFRCFYWDAGGSFAIDEDYNYYLGMSLFNRHTLEWVYPEIRDAFLSVNDTIEPTETPEPSETPVVSESPAPSETPEPSETPVVSESPAPSETPEPSETPVVSESPAPSETPVMVPDVAITSNYSSFASQSYTIKADASQNIDLSKLKIRFNYTKAGTKEECLKCDNAGISLSKAPYYINYTNNVISTFGDGYVDITFNEAYNLTDGSIKLLTRMYQKDWSSYSNFSAGAYEIFYDGQLVNTL